MIIFHIKLTNRQFQIPKTAAIIDTNMFRLVNPCLQSKMSIVHKFQIGCSPQNQNRVRYAAMQDHDDRLRHGVLIDDVCGLAILLRRITEAKTGLLINTK